VTSKAVVVATGVTEDGRREILGIEIGDSKDEAFWREFLRSLKRRRAVRRAPGDLGPARRTEGR
jgi:transposase-like protein